MSGTSCAAIGCPTPQRCFGSPRTAVTGRDAASEKSLDQIVPRVTTSSMLGLASAATIECYSNERTTCLRFIGRQRVTYDVSIMQARAGLMG